MMKKIKVSYVLAILNAERTLRDCLNGIFMQDFPLEEREIVIVDGGSKDGTLEIIKDFQKAGRKIKLIHNKHGLSEGVGMGKQQGVLASKGEFIVLLDHDNILMHKDWLKKMLAPFKDKDIMETQSLLDYKEGDSVFLKYVNTIGVEDAFAVPYSLVSQVVLNPSKFKDREDYYEYKINADKVLFAGANGGIFRRKTLDRIGGYTREVDVFAKMAKLGMKVAVVKETRLYHQTGSSFFTYLKKKATYFYRFIDYGYKEREFKWAGNSGSQRIKFYLRVLGNLLIIPQLLLSLVWFARLGKPFLLIHSFLVFAMTVMYGFITLIKFGNYRKYAKKS